MNYKGFQKEAIKKVVHGYESNEKNNRFLVADEVGLGKTIIAKGTIRCLCYLEYLKRGCPDDFEFNVLYLCSNLNIAEQNKSKLGVSKLDQVNLMDEVILGDKNFDEYKGNQLDAGSFVENRTTMLLKKMKELTDNNPQVITVATLRGECVEICGEEVIAAKEQELGISSINNDLKLKLNIIPVTTKTSIKINGKGHQIERNFIIDTVKKLYGEAVCDNITEEFRKKISDVKEKYPKFKALDGFMKELSEGKGEEKEGEWQSLRQLFALASIEILKYDFVIMDEFQNFSEVLQKANHTKEKKRNYYDKAQYIYSVLMQNGKYLKLADNIQAYYNIGELYELTNADKQFWNDKLEKVNFGENKELETLIPKFEELAKERLTYPVVEDSNTSNQGTYISKKEMLCLAKAILGRSEPEFVNQKYKEISGEDFIYTFAQVINLKDNTTKSAIDAYLEGAKKQNQLLYWWEHDQFVGRYQDLRDKINLSSKPKKKEPFNYLLNIHFSQKDENTDISYTILNCFIHFMEKEWEKVYLWQYAYLLTHQLAEDANRLEYSVEQLEPMRVFLGTYIRDEDLEDSAFVRGFENIIIEKIFDDEEKNGRYTKIMMLSATPFKMYIEENDKEDNNVNILEVCDFLDTNVHANLGQKLVDYKNALLRFSREQNKTIDEVLSKKDIFQQKMNNAFTRMERFAVLRELVEEWFTNSANTERKDELACGRIKELFEYLKQASVISKEGSIISYAEDAPYMGTFMHPGTSKEEDDGYAWKRAFDKEEEAGNVDFTEDSYVYLSKECFLRKEKPLGQWHGVYETSLGKILDLDVVNNGTEIMEAELRMNHPGAARLLWISSCASKDKLKGVFAEHGDYGKTIIFSRLVQVPRMIAGLTSYEVLRRLTWLIEKDCKDKGIFDYVLYNLDSKEDTQQLSTYQKLDKILERTQDSLEKRLLAEEKLFEGLVGIKTICRNAISKYCNKYLTKSQNANNTIRKERQDKLADSLAENLVKKVILNKHMGMFAIWASKGFYSKGDSVENLPEGKAFKKAFVEDCAIKILQYCQEGCLGDVLDEWLYICLDSEQDLGQFLGVRMDKEKKNVDCLSFTKATNLSVSLYENNNGKAKEVKKQDDNKGKGEKIANYFARCIGMSGDDDKISTIKGLQQSFNSPFAPFVFATTSMGQEGLDFHYYADKIIHWRLPSNPVDFEQREGRINRYHCLALRKKIIEWYGDNNDKDVYTKFENAFSKARTALLSDDTNNPIIKCGLVPDWILLDKNKQESVSIKRYVPYFYLSKTNEDYNKNLKVLQLYRSVIGQTNPEEVMERLMMNRNTEEVKSLFVDFSPYNRGIQNDNKK